MTNPDEKIPWIDHNPFTLDEHERIPSETIKFDPKDGNVIQTGDIELPPHVKFEDEIDNDSTAFLVGKIGMTAVLFILSVSAVAVIGIAVIAFTMQIAGLML